MPPTRHPAGAVTPVTEQEMWLRSMLVDKGVLSESGLTRNAGIRTCRTCRAQCLAGIAITGLDAWADLGQLHAAGELAALLAGRPTLSLFAGRQLVPRDRHWIRAYPAGAGSRPAYAAHRCGEPTPAEWQAITPRPAAPTIEEMPF